VGPRGRRFFAERKTTVRHACTKGFRKEPAQSWWITVFSAETQGEGLLAALVSEGLADLLLLALTAKLTLGLAGRYSTASNQTG
jgi:hypothetical protein